jgi:hypothetical protein
MPLFSRGYGFTLKDHVPRHGTDGAHASGNGRETNFFREREGARAAATPTASFIPAQGNALGLGQ